MAKQMTTTDIGVRPEDDREGIGFHVLKAPSGSFVIAYWNFIRPLGGVWQIDGDKNLCTPLALAVRGYSYIGIFTEPDEVTRLQDRVEELESLDDALSSDPTALIKEAYFEGWKDSHWARRGAEADDSDWRQSETRFILDELSIADIQEVFKNKNR